jgi:hypothetical protein
MESVYVTCGCSDKKYQYSASAESRHFKTVKHQSWIREDSAHVYEQIEIECPCGGSFDLFTQLQHLKSPNHQKWQSIGSNKDMMPFICQCSFIVPYGQLKEHRSSAQHVIPTFEIERKSPWKISER